MIQASGVIICLGYILGLLLSTTPWGGILILCVSIIAAIIFQRRRIVSKKFALQKTKSQEANKAAHTLKASPHPRIFLIAGLLGFLATVYFQLRLPQPEAKDISHFVPVGNSKNQEQLVIVRGDVASIPRLTRSGSGQFWLQATQLSEVTNQREEQKTSKEVSGRLYVTVPLLKSTGLYPNQQIEVTGVLYKPNSAFNPGAFDFEKYLQKQGAFAGLSGRQLKYFDKEHQWGWWKLRQRIISSQVRWLGVPEGPLVSAMVLGSKAVDLPYSTRDLFVQTGLAHSIAASGFHTSLILGLVLSLTRRFTRKTQFICGCLALIIFLSLTGFQPSVLRAVIMGFAALIGIGLKRKVKQLGSLIVAAALLLLINPLWIWDLGFQLSFLATLGLITTVPSITKYLGWLPPTIASLIAVPISATIWTLPLQLYVFGVVPAYGILLNIISTPLISVISIGGIISAVAALIFPFAGSVSASVLHYPTDLLIKIVEFFRNLPGNSVALGTIAIWQVLTIYGLIFLTWQIRWWQRRWFVAALISIGLVFIPAWHSANNLFRITLLAAEREPVLVIQDRGKITVINSAEEDVGRFTVVPFLQQQGVNLINWAIAVDFQNDGSSGWLEIIDRLPIKVFYDYPSPNTVLTQKAIQAKVQQDKGIYQVLSLGQTVNTGSAIIKMINNKLPIIQMQILDRSWLFVGNTEPNELRQLIETQSLPRPQVLWCPTKSLKELVIALQPEVAIAPNPDLEAKDVSILNQSKTQLFFTGRDGAIQWTPQRLFETYVQNAENMTSLL
ncbi:ComEC/Rec2 family competence protein [Rivularia sp. UHCC 0363]|uniref:ComEC/Rec2 family competence protein n=1 Tax=Rivularia sp. UHCC 0363 TaxID=3110244 RepID=UPI002B1F8F29|nr:ComEC/Rec2 family competence protein [Rivularia sp. UHCC 0363]MEA5598588.1 ComEC/Rec2 family competence protein [Rivularia sp. UHCC 0363]